MSRPFFGSGFFPTLSPPPEVYTALVALYGGDEAAADAWLAGWIAYVGTSAASDEILAALQGIAPDVAVQILRTAPVSLTTDFGPEISPPLYDATVEVVGVIAPGAPSIATAF